MVDVDIEDGLGYPTRGENVLAVHGLGGALPVAVHVVLGIVAFVGLLFPPLYLLFVPLGLVLLAVGVFWVGYFLRVARTAFAGGDELPALGDWGGLARDGLVGTLVATGYQVPTVALTLLAYGLLFGWAFGMEALQADGAGSGMAAFGVVGMVLFFVLFVVAFLWAAAATYFTPISLLAYADEGRVGAAVSWPTLKRLATSGDYAVAWIATAGGAFAVWSVVSLLASFLVGYLLMPFLPLVFFYLGIAGFHMTGRAYAMEFDPAVPDAAGGGATAGSASGGDVTGEDGTGGGTADDDATVGESGGSPAGTSGPRGPEDV